tara:strand:- start:3605 stop:5344 length:1740 start_codon:yes stop_codon:yes gene_type:complete
MKLLLLLLLLLNNLLAVGEAGAIFLLIAPGAGPQGTGEAQVAKADDAYATFYNPAGLAFLSGREAVGMHVQWLPNLADDLFYEFIAYRHELPGIGVVGGNLTYLNLGKQMRTDDVGTDLGYFGSWMGAVTLSFGTKLSSTSSIGMNYKIFKQALAPDSGAGSEETEGSSTDFAFDIGYLKKFKQSPEKSKMKKIDKINDIFQNFSDIYVQQKRVSEEIDLIWKNEMNIYALSEKQQDVLYNLEKNITKLSIYQKYLTWPKLNGELKTIVKDMEYLIDNLDELNIGVNLENETLKEAIEEKSNIILDYLLDIVKFQDSLILEVSEASNSSEEYDKFNFGISISNIGPPIYFMNKNQADPAPTNMRIGFLASLYNDGFSKVNLLFDANKILVARYPAMDWNGDGIISGTDENAHDDPWYKAIVTAWLDDWYYGGDYDYDGDNIIGGYIENPNYDPEWGDSDVGSCPTGNCHLEYIDGELDWGHANYSSLNSQGIIEKGSGESRSFSDELEEIIYNIGLEYWYTESFVLRTGFIYDIEGDISNPTFGAGIRLLQYGFDFGYTAGDQGHARANTMFFSVNMEL